MTPPPDTACVAECALCVASVVSHRDSVVLLYGWVILGCDTAVRYGECVTTSTPPGHASAALVPAPCGGRNPGPRFAYKYQ